MTSTLENLEMNNSLLQSIRNYEQLNEPVRWRAQRLYCKIEAYRWKVKREQRRSIPDPEFGHSNLDSLLRYVERIVLQDIANTKGQPDYRG